MGSKMACDSSLFWALNMNIYSSIITFMLSRLIWSLYRSILKCSDVTTFHRILRICYVFLSILYLTTYVLVVGACSIVYQFFHPWLMTFCLSIQQLHIHTQGFGMFEGGDLFNHLFEAWWLFKQSAWSMCKDYGLSVCKVFTLQLCGINCENC